MAEDRMHILRMLQEKKISVAEAERLLAAVSSLDQAAAPPAPPEFPAPPTPAVPPVPPVPPVDMADVAAAVDFADVDFAVDEDFLDLEDLSHLEDFGVDVAPLREPRPEGKRSRRVIRKRDGRKGRGRHFTEGWDIRTSELLNALRPFGIDELREHELHELRIHDVTPAYIDALREAGVSDLRLRDLLQLRIQGVEAEYVAALRQHFPQLNLRHITEFAIHGIEASYIVQLREHFPEISARDIREFGIHGIEPGDVARLRQEMAARGYADLRVKDVVKLHIHDFEPAYIDDLRALGFDDLSLRLILKLWVNEVDAATIAAARAEHPDASAREILALHRRERRDVEGELYDLKAYLRELGFARVTTGQIFDVLALGIDTESLAAAREANPDLTLSDLIQQARAARQQD